MTKGKKPLIQAEILNPDSEPDMIGGALANMRETAQGALASKLAAEQHTRAVALQVGYLLPGDCIDPDLIQRDIAANMRRSVEACLEVGRGLVVLKSACEHGQFMVRLDVLGIDRKVAAKFMQSANKFSNVSSTRHLLEAAGNQTKLFELLILEDDQVEELELTGQTGELKLDEIATMSVKELRTALREARQKVKDKQDELEATEQISAEKTLKLEKLQRRIQTIPPDEVLAELHTEATRIFHDIRGGVIGALRQAVLSLHAHHQNHGGDSGVLLGGLVGQLSADLQSLCDEFALPAIEADLHGWIDQAEG